MRLRKSVGVIFDPPNIFIFRHIVYYVGRKDDQLIVKNVMGMTVENPKVRQNVLNKYFDVIKSGEMERV